MSYESDLDAAWKLGTKVENLLRGDGHDSPRQLRVQLEMMTAYKEAADRTVVSCQRQIQDLEWKRMDLHSQEAAARFDDTIAGLGKMSDRAADVRALMSDTIRLAQRALNRYEERRRSLSKPG